MPSGTNDSKLDPTVLELANEPNYAAFTTLLPSGHPQTQMMWVDTDGQHIRINTEVHRQKFKNVERDPRVTVMIRDENNPFRYAEVRGEVVEKVRGPEAREHIDELSRKYLGGPYQNPIQSERVLLRITPLRQFVFA
jgi:PPOX class probable F420-dependent enzyme